MTYVSCRRRVVGLSGVQLTPDGAENNIVVVDEVSVSWKHQVDGLIYATNRLSYLEYKKAMVRAGRLRAYSSHAVRERGSDETAACRIRLRT